MFDIGAGELLIIGVVALVVIGPKELPGVLRQVGKATAKMRQMAGEFRAQFDEAMREAEIEDAKKSLTGLKDTVVSTATGLNPLADIQNEIHSSTAMLNTPYVPVETASPVAPLDVNTPPMVAAPKAAPPKRAKKASVVSPENLAGKPAKKRNPAKAVISPNAQPEAIAPMRPDDNIVPLRRKKSPVGVAEAAPRAPKTRKTERT